MHVEGAWPRQRADWKRLGKNLSLRTLIFTRRSEHGYFTPALFSGEGDIENIERGSSLEG